MSKERTSDKRRQEDRTLNRVLAWFGGAVVLEFLLLLLNRFYIHFDPSGVELAYGLAKLLEVLTWAGLAAVAASSAWIGVWKSKDKSLTGPVACLAASLVVTACAFVARTWKDVGVQFLCLIVPACVVLALIFRLFHREYFLIALQGSAALLGIWAYFKLYPSQTEAMYMLYELGMGVIVSTAILTWYLKRADGYLRGRQMLDKKANYPLLFISSFVMGFAILVRFGPGQTGGYVSLLIVVAWLFATAVYYAVKRM